MSNFFDDLGKGLAKGAGDVGKKIAQDVGTAVTSAVAGAIIDGVVHGAQQLNDAMRGKEDAPLPPALDNDKKEDK